MQIRSYIFTLLLVFLSGCTNNLYQQQFYVFGTLVEISIWGVSTSQASEAVNAIANDFQIMHRSWHAWNPSPLTDLNQTIAAGQTWLVTDKSLLPLLKQAKYLYNQSDGLFNPAIGQLIKLWGFQDDNLGESANTAPPSSTKIAELIALTPSMNDVKIKDSYIYSSNKAVQLDFGAFAKGYAIDLAIEKLRQYGIQNAIVNAGGNLKVIGKKGNKPWLIGIRHPSGSGVLASISVNSEESIITSGNYERYQEYQGIRYSHIIDPRNGMPAQGLTSVTVIDRSGTIADAAATALTVAGLQYWHKIARQMKIKYVMLVDDKGTVYVNPSMAARVQFSTSNPPKIIVLKIEKG